MALVSCPSCSKPIAEDATTCPKCGHPLPPGWAEKRRQDEKAGAFYFVIFVAIVVVGWGIYSVISSAISDWRENPTTDKAWSYRVVDQEDHDGPRKKVIAYIYSDAPDFTSRAQTALKAAMEIERDSNAALATVFIVPTPSKVFAGKGLYVARALYAKDGQGIDGTAPLAHGRWEAFAHDVQSTPLRRKVLEQFEESIDKHPILRVSCTDQDIAEKGQKRWADALNISYSEFQDWQLPGKSPSDLRERISGGTTGVLQEWLVQKTGCTLAAGDDDATVFQEIARKLNIPSDETASIEHEFARANGLREYSE